MTVHASRPRIQVLHKDEYNTTAMPDCIGSLLLAEIPCGLGSV